MATSKLPERPQQYRKLFAKEMADVKRQYGNGLYSWVGNMSRREARRIARNRARNMMRIRRGHGPQ